MQHVLQDDGYSDHSCEHFTFFGVSRRGVVVSSVESRPFIVGCKESRMEKG